MSAVQCQWRKWPPRQLAGKSSIEHDKSRKTSFNDMVDARFVTEAMEERSARSEGYDFSKSIENIKKKRFHFGARNREANAVDIALANLFECLSVECRWSPQCSAPLIKT